MKYTIAKAIQMDTLIMNSTSPVTSRTISETQFPSLSTIISHDKWIWICLVHRLNNGGLRHSKFASMVRCPHLHGFQLSGSAHTFAPTYSTVVMGDVGFPPLWMVQLLIRGVKMAINNGRNDLIIESRVWEPEAGLKICVTPPWVTGIDCTAWKVDELSCCWWTELLDSLD